MSRQRSMRILLMRLTLSKVAARGKNKIDKKAIHSFIDKLDVPAVVKKELKAISPHNYTGVHPEY